MLQIESVSAGYGESKVLHDVSVRVETGKVVSIMGRNGVGKTTLLKCVTGLVRVGEGRILLDGRDIARWSPSERAAFGVGYAPQGREIFPSLSVQENLMLGLYAKKGLGRVIPDGIFQLFPVLKSMLKKRGGDLSGGQQQQLAIARALITEPKLLLLDEPTEGIQPNIVQDIENAIRFIKEQGTISIILVEQFLEFALRLADSYYVLEKGRVVASGLIHEADRDQIKKHLTV